VTLTRLMKVTASEVCRAVYFKNARMMGMQMWIPGGERNCSDVKTTATG